MRSEMKRRRWLGTLGVGAIASVAGCTNGDGDNSDGFDFGDDATETPLDELPLIDAHLHVIPQETLGRDPLLADDVVDWMDRHGVDRGVILPLASPEAYPVLAPSWWAVQQAQQHPDRLIPFFVLDPRTGEAYGRDVLEEQFERYVEAENARGFGEYKPGLEIGDPRNEPIYELCAAYDLPLLFHSDDKAFVDDADHTQLEDVLRSYPEVDFLGHGMGWWARISGDVRQRDLGGYPEGPVEAGGAVPRLLSEYDNIYGELSGRSGFNAVIRDRAFGREFLEAHADQLIFGTDYLHPGHDVPNFELFDVFELSAEKWAAIRSRNLEAVLPD